MVCNGPVKKGEHLSVVRQVLHDRSILTSALIMCPSMHWQPGTQSP